MVKLIFTPWKSRSQLLDVRSQFYPSPSYDGPDMRSHACATVEAWKLRGNVPHHVEATALLTDAILHDDAQRNSIFSIRATYSAAFCRFVTGLVDSKIHGQRKTMFQRAMDLGLPASFVELRHEATHRAPPSLVVLRKATHRSLEWLWENYWAGIDNTGDVPAVESDDSASIKAALFEVLQLYSGVTSSAEPPRKRRKRDHEASVATQLVSICSVAGRGARVLSGVLLDESLLVPRGRKIGESLDETFDRWDPVLQHVADNDPSFLMYLTEDLTNELAFNPATHLSSSAYAEALFLWLDHILDSASWEPHMRFCSHSYIMRVCDESSGHWAKMLKERLREKSETISIQAASTARNLASKDAAAKPRTADSNARMTGDLLEHGWGFLEKWDSRSLGVASGS